MNDASSKDNLPEGLEDKTVLGFWIYLLSDLVMFGTLLAAYLVLFDQKIWQEFKANIYSLNLLALTILSVCVGFLAELNYCLIKFQKRKFALIALTSIMVCEVLFLWIEKKQGQLLTELGYRWDTHATLSAFYTLIATHALHVVLGTLWTALFTFSLVKGEVSATKLRRSCCLKLFWQFLHLIWIVVVGVMLIQVQVAG